MRTIKLAWVLAFLIPSIASAEGLWNDYFTVVGRLSNSSKNCDPVTNTTCYYDVLQATPATHTTPILDLRECENFSFSWTGSIVDNTEVDNTIVCYELQCATIDATNHDCAEIIGNVTLDGDPSTATNTAAFYGVDAGLVYCVATMGEAGTTARLRLSCFPRR